MTDREPTAWLNYRGDRRETVGQVMGPTHEGFYMLTAVEATFDPEANSTRVGLAHGILRLSPEERAAAMKVAGQEEQREQQEET